MLRPVPLVLLAFATLSVAVAPLAPAAGVDEAGPVERFTLRCSGDALSGETAPVIPALENRRDEGFVCWGHSGIHTYYLGNHSFYRLEGGFGSLYAVEQGVIGQGAGLSLQPPSEPGPAIEVSADGLTWTLLRYAEVPKTVLLRPTWKFLFDRVPGERPNEDDAPGVYAGRVTVRFTLDAYDEPFRFLRVRMAESHTRGLSGYLDNSDLLVNVTRVAPAPPAVPAPKTRAEYDCGAHLLDDVFDEHPCTFGGAQYFESPSFYHTYALAGLAHPTRVSGHAVFLPYRSIGGVQQPAYGNDTITGYVEVSRAGRLAEDEVRQDDWVKVASFEAPFGVPARFDVDGLEGVHAQFVRIRAERHALWSCKDAQGREACAGTHHMAGFLASSTLVLDGVVPPHARGTGPHSEAAWALHAAALPVPTLPEAPNVPRPLLG